MPTYTQGRYVCVCGCVSLRIVVSINAFTIAKLLELQHTYACCTLLAAPVDAADNVNRMSTTTKTTA